MQKDWLIDASDILDSLEAQALNVSSLTQGFKDKINLMGPKPEVIWAIIALNESFSEEHLQLLGKSLADLAIESLWALGDRASEVAEGYAKLFPGSIACWTDLKGLEAALFLAMKAKQAQSEQLSPRLLLIDRLPAGILSVLQQRFKFN